MKRISQVFGSILGRSALDNDSAVRQQIYREWDRQRAMALSPSDLAEIDAIFSRNV